ncbi:MAG: malate dehydrogenase [Magnetococcales bacterium]|nr:malate dehydrogenase [Magnetococcales bacterium]
MARPIRVAVTGAAGNISYSLLFRIAAGDVFGKDRPVQLRLLEIPAAMKVLEGVVMELDDCGFATLQSVVVTDKPTEAFDGVNCALLVGSKPRSPGMQRSDLIRENGPIFVGQGKALDRAAEDVRILVVGNPCNTNCLIAMSNSMVPQDRFTAMMALDHNRATSMLAHKAHVPVAAVSHVTIWGNHSNNQYPDFENALINDRPVTEVIADEQWLREDFVKAVQERGAEILKVRGGSSAASAANAAIDAAKFFNEATPDNQWYSIAVRSDGQYGVDKGLIFGYPVRYDGKGSWEVVEGLNMSDWAKGKFQKVLDELRQEREVVKDLLQ